jgi:hypothetical protein
MIWKGPAKRIEDVDLPRIGHLIGVGEDEVHALMDVEAAGSGFDAQGRVKILFEPHIFYRQLAGNSAKQLSAVNQGLAYRKWGMKPYPKDSYPRLEAAIKIDREAALNSCSWGLAQIMGFNYRQAGYKSAEEMVIDFADDEDNHLEAMIRFILAMGIDDELRRHDWAGFAKVYNGEGYKKNKYDEKLAAAYAKWAKIRDTPWSPGQETEPKPAPPPENVPATPPVTTSGGLWGWIKRLFGIA